MQTELCPGCRAYLPRLDGPTHRYIGASAACWAIFTALHNGGEPPLAPAATNALLVDAYAAQHPGQPSRQAIQSVAVHLLTLHSIFAHQAPIEQALALRLAALQERRGSRHERYQWLNPPPVANDTLTVAAIVAEPTPEARSAAVACYVRQVYNIWVTHHRTTIETWYQQFIQD